MVFDISWNSFFRLATMDLYYHPAPAASRACLLAAKAVGVDPNLKVINMFAGEQNKPEFVKVKIKKKSC